MHWLMMGQVIGFLAGVFEAEVTVLYQKSYQVRNCVYLFAIAVVRKFPRSQTVKSQRRSIYRKEKMAVIADERPTTKPSQTPLS